jgi:hypothetical protein
MKVGAWLFERLVRCLGLMFCDGHSKAVANQQGLEKKGLLTPSYCNHGLFVASDTC